MKRRLIPGDRRVLGVLSDRRGHTLRELCTVIGVNASTMQRKVTRLREVGLVEKNPHTHARAIRLMADVFSNEDGSLVAWLCAEYPALVEE